MLICHFIESTPYSWPVSEVTESSLVPTSEEKVLLTAETLSLAFHCLT